MNEPVLYHPGYMAKLVGFTISFKDWALAGFPRRDPDEVRELFNTYCNPSGHRCEQYDPDARTIPIVGIKGVCLGCGCHVSSNPAELLNALTIPTKSCPMGKFGASVDKEK